MQTKKIASRRAAPGGRTLGGLTKRAPSVTIEDRLAKLGLTEHQITVALWATDEYVAVAPQGEPKSTRQLLKDLKAFEKQTRDYSHTIKQLDHDVARITFVGRTSADTPDERLKALTMQLDDILTMCKVVFKSLPETHPQSHKHYWRRAWITRLMDVSPCRSNDDLLKLSKVVETLSKHYISDENKNLREANAERVIRSILPSV